MSRDAPLPELDDRVILLLSTTTYRAEAFLEASREELEGVPGLPAKTARLVYAQLHKAGRG